MKDHKKGLMQQLFPQEVGWTMADVKPFETLESLVQEDEDEEPTT